MSVPFTPIPADLSDLPDLLITVDFDALGITSEPFDNMRAATVYIFVGLTTSTGDIMSATKATPLVPGLNLYGRVSPELRQNFLKPSMSSINIFTVRDYILPLCSFKERTDARLIVSNQESKSFLVAKMPVLVPDPSTVVPRVNNTATLRLTIDDLFGSLTVTTESRQQSALSGVANIGGLWTFLNGIFALLFGSSLLFILFGTPSLPRHRFSLLICL
jgi:hypothetical protein